MMLDDRLLGALVAAGGLAYATVAFGLPGIPGQAYGAGFFPSIIGVATTLAGVALVVRGFARRAAAADAGGASPEASAGRITVLAGMLRFASILAAIAFYILFSGALGFVLTSLIIIVVLSLILGARPLLAAGVAVGTTALLSVVFGRLLRVPLPVGPLDVFR